MKAIITSPATMPLAVDLWPDRLTDQEFTDFCERNPDSRIERKANGDISIMPPTHSKTGQRNAELIFQLKLWSRQNGTGAVFDSSTGFRLPNTAILSPDASWVANARLAQLTEGERQGFFPLCPDFVIELRSTTDRLKDLQAKMEEYLANGTRLGWLIDADQRRIYVYRAGQTVEILDNLESIGGDDVLPGFVLHTAEVWAPIS